MKTLKLFFGLLIGLMILSSCSSNEDSNENNDIIIGKWRAIEKYESNELVDLPTCLPHVYTEYKIDNVLTGGKIIFNDFPSECNSLVFDLLISKNLGNNNYRIHHANEEGSVYKLYKNGINLVEENPNGITKIIYEPY